MVEMQSSKLSDPRVVCAAIRFKDGTIVPSARHHDPLMRSLCVAMGRERLEICKSEQGFIDQHRNFLTRDEAAVIAKEKNQITRPTVPFLHGTGLFSEHLY